MESEVKELYQQVILDHNRSPRNFKKLEDANHFSEGFNPLCGDHINIFLKIENEIITDISFQGQGCAISKSSASVMTSILKGKTIEEAKNLFNKFQELVTGKDNFEIDEIGKLAVFQGVREFPARVKCASLPWHTMNNALKNEIKVTSTE